MIEIDCKHIIVVCKYKNSENMACTPTGLRDKVLRGVLHGKKIEKNGQAFNLARLLITFRSD